MSKSSRRSAPVFGSESSTAVLDGPEAPETPVDAQEAPETPDTAAQEPLEAAEGQGEVPEGQQERGPTPEDFKGAAEAAANESVIDPSDPRAAQPGKLAEQVNQALQPEEIAAKMSVEAELKTFLGETVVPLPDGSVRCTVIVDADKCEILRSWAEGAGESFEDYLTKMVSMGLEAIVNGGAVAG